MIYKIKIADGDTIIYETDLTLEQLKSYISNNDFIEIPRKGTVNIKNGVKFVPTFASYRTTSIVYIKGIFYTYTFEFNFNEIRFEITSDTTREECLERYKFLWYQQELPKDFKG